MKSKRFIKRKMGLASAVALLGLIGFASVDAMAAWGGDPLPSWNDGAAKSAILDFVKDVTKKGGPDYVAPAKRIATFDHDGTLWVESPMYTQILFGFDRAKKLAPQHPEWETKQPFKALLAGDMKTVAASGMTGVMQILMATHSGMTAEEFEAEASAWLATAKHPKFDRLYSRCIYQPQLELLAYLALRDSRPSSSPAAAYSSCAPSVRQTTGFLPRMWSAPVSSVNFR
jgi:hypothetical protein